MHRIGRNDELLRHSDDVPCQRILRSVIVFAALVAAYQAYVLLAVPLMEPPLAVQQAADRADRRMRQGDGNAVTKYQLLLVELLSRRIIGRRRGRRR